MALRRRQIDKSVATNALRLLKEKHKTVSWLSTQIGMSRQLLDYKLREGRFFISDIEEIAKALGVSRADIIGG